MRLERTLEPATAAACSVSGKDNFSVARAAAYGGAASLVVGHALLLAAFVPPGPGALFPATFVALYGAVAVHQVGEVERKAPGPGHAAVDVPRTPPVVVARAGWAFVASLLAFVAVVLPAYRLGAGACAVGFGLCSFSLYAAFHFRSGGKSVFSRASDAVRDAADSLTARPPALVPVPVRTRR